MAIVYCDWAAGNDTTGDGSAGNPYKTITKASTGLTGGDEVRVAKGPARTAITASLTWTKGSRTVTGPGDLTSEIAQYAIIAKASAGPPGDPETVYEVGTISYNAGTDTTTITLGTDANHKYAGDTETCASVIINALDTGSTGQIVSAGGSGTVNRLTVSGGWNLAGTPAQDGETWFVQRNANPATKAGDGLDWDRVSYLQIQDLGFLRYFDGLYGYMSFQNRIERCTVACGNFGVSKSANRNIFVGCVASGGYIGFQQYGDWAVEYHNCSAYGHSSVGFHAVNRGALCGLLLGCTCRQNLVAVRVEDGLTSTSDMVLENNGTDFLIIAPRTSETRCAMTHHNWNVVGVHVAQAELGGMCKRDTATYRGASGESVQVAPTSASTALEVRGLDDWFVAAATSGENLTLSIYAKAGATWNGKCWLEGVINGRSCIGPTEKTLTTDWAEYTVTIPAAYITETGPIASLRIYVTGTVGVVNFDDFSWSSAAP